MSHLISNKQYIPLNVLSQNDFCKSYTFNQELSHFGPKEVAPKDVTMKVLDFKNYLDSLYTNEMLSNPVRLVPAVYRSVLCGLLQDEHMNATSTVTTQSLATPFFDPFENMNFQDIMFHTNKAKGALFYNEFETMHRPPFLGRFMCGFDSNGAGATVTVPATANQQDKLWKTWTAGSPAMNVVKVTDQMTDLWKNTTNLPDPFSSRTGLYTMGYNWNPKQRVMLMREYENVMNSTDLPTTENTVAKASIWPVAFSLFTTLAIQKLRAPATDTMVYNTMTTGAATATVQVAMRPFNLYLYFTTLSKYTKKNGAVPENFGTIFVPPSIWKGSTAGQLGLFILAHYHTPIVDTNTIGYSSQVFPENVSVNTSLQHNEPWVPNLARHWIRSDFTSSIVVVLCTESEDDEVGFIGDVGNLAFSTITNSPYAAAPLVPVNFTNANMNPVNTANDATFLCSQLTCYMSQHDVERIKKAALLMSWELYLAHPALSYSLGTAYELGTSVLRVQAGNKAFQEFDPTEPISITTLDLFGIPADYRNNTNMGSFPTTYAFGALYLYTKLLAPAQPVNANMNWWVDAFRTIVEGIYTTLPIFCAIEDSYATMANTWTEIDSVRSDSVSLRVGHERMQAFFRDAFFGIRVTIDPFRTTKNNAAWSPFNLPLGITNPHFSTFKAILDKSFTMDDAIKFTFETAMADKQLGIQVYTTSFSDCKMYSKKWWMIQCTYAAIYAVHCGNIDGQGIAGLLQPFYCDETYSPTTVIDNHPIVPVSMWSTAIINAWRNRLGIRRARRHPNIIPTDDKAYWTVTPRLPRIFAPNGTSVSDKFIIWGYHQTSYTHIATKSEWLTGSGFIIENVDPGKLTDTAQNIPVNLKKIVDPDQLF